MNIAFANRRLEKLCCDDAAARKELGAECARKLRQRLDEMHACAILAEMACLPGKCHELTGDRRGCLAVHLIEPYRLVFKPEGQDIHKPDGGLDWTKVKGITITWVGDYHGH
jgi:proteic killer suppression protein